VCGALSDATAAVRVAQRLVEAFAEPFVLRSGEAFVGICVGITVSQGDVDDPEVLLRDADAAMYRAKSQGGNRYEVFDAHLGDEALRRAAIDTDLHRALERREFRLVYQPTVTMADSRVEGVEALLRWDSPERGTVSPVEFIPMLEENGLIEQVGAWVLREACAQLGRWRAEAGGDLELRMAVNLSARQLAQPDLVEIVCAALADADVPSELLTLEITESVSMQDTEATLARLDELGTLGVELAIDDFGTGYSSLAYLHRLPVDVLKIDRAFVSRLSDSVDEAPIVNAILELGHALGLAVLAEGIETQEQAEYLRRHGCDLGQGYLFARPIAPEEVAALLGITG